MTSFFFEVVAFCTNAARRASTVSFLEQKRIVVVSFTRTRGKVVLVEQFFSSDFESRGFFALDDEMLSERLQSR